MSGIWEMIMQGGIVMIPLLLLSIIGLTVFIERALFLRRRRIFKPEIVFLVNSMKHPSDIEDGLDRLKGKNGPFVNVVRTGLEKRDQPKEEIKESIIEQGRQEARSMEKGLVVLETVAGIAPLLGLLGTVLGMIRVFQVISEQGLGQTQSLSGGISQALITTVVGLSIAIPALVAYNYFTHKVEDLILEIEKYSSQLLTQLDIFKKRGDKLHD
jgi:biopolymer transport protein ExbB